MDLVAHGRSRTLELGYGFCPRTENPELRALVRALDHAIGWDLLHEYRGVPAALSGVWTASPSCLTAQTPSEIIRFVVVLAPGLEITKAHPVRSLLDDATTGCLAQRTHDGAWLSSIRDALDARGTGVAHVEIDASAFFRTASREPTHP